MDTQNTTISREQFLKIFSHYENNNLLKEIYFNDVYSIAKNDTDSQCYLFIYSEKNILNPEIAKNQYFFQGYPITKEQCEKFANNTWTVKALLRELKKEEFLPISFYHLERMLRNTDTENAKQTKQFIESQKKVFTDSDIMNALNSQTSNVVPVLMFGLATIFFIFFVASLIVAEPIFGDIITTIIMGGVSLSCFASSILSKKINQRSKKAFEEYGYRIVKTICVNVTKEKDEDYNVYYIAKFANGDSKKYSTLIPHIGDIFYLVYINNTRKLFRTYEACNYTPDTNLKNYKN